jgi:uncharacterized protein YjbJ (UPF0337 family)
MNFDQIKGKFKEWKGDFKAKWGRLTDDDWVEIAGEKDKLIGKLQQKYGRTREDAKREVDDYFAEHERKVS